MKRNKKAKKRDKLPAVVDGPFELPPSTVVMVREERRDRIKVRMGNRVFWCDINGDGEAVIPLGAGIDFELTTALENVMRKAGIPDADIAKAMDDVRVEWVLGPGTEVEWTR